MSWLVAGLIIGGAVGLVNGVIFGALCVALARQDDADCGGCECFFDEAPVSHANWCDYFIDPRQLCDCQGVR